MTAPTIHIPNYPPSWEPTRRTYPTTDRSDRDYPKFDDNETCISLSVGGVTFPCTKEMLVWEDPNGVLGVLAANRGDPSQPFDFANNSALDRRCPVRFAAILRYLNVVVDDVPFDRTPQGVAHLAAVWADADFYGLPRLKSIVMFRLTKLVWYLLCNSSTSYTSRLDVADGESIACGSVCHLTSVTISYDPNALEEYFVDLGLGKFYANPKSRWSEVTSEHLMLAASNVERVCQHYLQSAIISSAALHAEESQST